MRKALLPDRKRPLIFAHRGCSSLGPENTMAAFHKARELGAPGIELDIHICATGELVVAHDYTFTRVAPQGWNGQGKAIEELSLGDIRRIDVGAGFGGEGVFRGEYPPRLEEVLESFCPDMYIDIELKSEKAQGDPLPGAAAETLKRLGQRIAGAVTVSSFNPFALAAFKKLCPLVPAAIIWSAHQEVPWFLRRGLGRIISGCDYLKPIHNQVNPYRAFLSRLEKRPVVPWTVDDPGRGKELLDLGCQGIISNFPQRFISS
jgi:glycerophosphoryl diester phosphodiesterase